LIIGVQQHFTLAQFGISYGVLALAWGVTVAVVVTVTRR